ncbi:MAG: hypothetical protein M3N91_07850 [Pseudomonadota bacterium]|nr:hypothetical protein [Pseudomonadota bacterium]
MGYHDGNGRTGRLLMPLMLAAEGYPPLYLCGALLRSKSQYYAALASVQQQMRVPVDGHPMSRE